MHGLILFACLGKLLLGLDNPVLGKIGSALAGLLDDGETTADSGTSMALVSDHCLAPWSVLCIAINSTVPPNAKCFSRQSMHVYGVLVTTT